jgi:hypothetical protein
MNTRNKTYENQNLWCIKPLITAIKIVWIISIKPIASGWFIWENISIVINLIDRMSFSISGNII